MKQSSPFSSDLASRLTDLLVLMMSFIVFNLLVGADGLQHSLVDLLLYVSVLFVSLRLSKRLVFGSFSRGPRCLNTIYGNVLGIVIGTTVLLLADALLPFIHENLLVIIFASLMAFFILGTLSPVVKSSHKDIIHH